MLCEISHNIRVSTHLQSSGLEAQVRQIRLYCEQMQYPDVEIFTDENQSGAKQNRPALDRMMKAVRNKEVEMVIVPAFSRLARSTTHLLKALDEFQANGVSFISLSERLDTSTASGKMAFTVLAAVSHYAKFGVMRSNGHDRNAYQLFTLILTPHKTTA